jgi:hypothetical protein
LKLLLMFSPKNTVLIDGFGDSADTADIDSATNFANVNAAVLSKLFSLLNKTVSFLLTHFTIWTYISRNTMNKFNISSDFFCSRAPTHTHKHTHTLSAEQISTEL